MENNTLLRTESQRLLSIDFFRGLTMFLLVAGGPYIFSSFRQPEFEGTFLYSIGMQFTHHPWDGLRFWDLVQPFFMFIVGVSIPFSFGKRWDRGDSWGTTFKHAIKRSILLLTFGIALACIGSGKMTLELWNVLAQLSVTYLVAFLFMRKSIKVQLFVTAGLLIATELLYRLWPIAGYNQPFVPDHNFGSWVDMLLMGKLSSGHWASVNALPTTAHTMWGVIAGLILKSDRKDRQKIIILLIAGAIGVVAGYALHPVTPIIKRICTSSFVLVSGGWSLVALAFSFWLVDVRKIQRVPFFFAIVGMNPLFIYIFKHVGGAKPIERIIYPFSHGLFGWIGKGPADMITSFIFALAIWYVCYWLYKNKIFIRI
jgi:predicted acyltransferase